MKLFLQIRLIVTSLLLVVLVLLHRGRGGGLSSLFGGGMQSSLSGSSVVEKNLDRITLFVGRDLGDQHHRPRTAGEGVTAAVPGKAKISAVPTRTCAAQCDTLGV